MAAATDASGGWQRLALPGADVALWPQWLAPGEADPLFAELASAIAWENHRIRLFGREVASPRLSCWIGDPGAIYTYSRSRFEPRPWPAVLQLLRGRVEQTCGARFNSVLANLYRDGNDAMGWHSDDEPELGERPVIASLSLGAARRFRLRRRRARGESPQPGDRLDLVLPHGSLLRMAGDTQRLCQHELPRVRQLAQARINLTFRLVDTPPA
ncbi:alpha-ketoglutarate-dependent dioxygenase AlkB family protein [Rhodanobacter aciditrophus]|uniref:alpha-ketoglutarate-dependent dioxygenase AlkB family protein n=1 Tax=Rhodanobacter aciditrophus TaxID=1623218 RepID=UPI003CF6D34A